VLRKFWVVTCVCCMTELGEDGHEEGSVGMVLVQCVESFGGIGGVTDWEGNLGT